MKLRAMTVAMILSAGAADAALVGDEITVSGLNEGNLFEQTGVVGTDTFSWIVSAPRDTRFDLVFTDDSIELGFSTNFPSGGWVLNNPTTITISGLDWGGKGSLASASLFETVEFPELAPSDLTFTDNSVTLDLSNAFLQNGETVRIDLTPQHMAAVPLPAAGWMLLAGIGGLFGARRLRK